MTQCQGCSLKFPSLNLPHCGKCTKKNQASSQIDRDVIDVILFRLLLLIILCISQKYPQCSGCGIVYQWLKGILCGGCIQRSETGTLISSIECSPVTLIITEPQVFEGILVNSLSAVMTQGSFKRFVEYHEVFDGSCQGL
jgi:hypothetical protein